MPTIQADPKRNALRESPPLRDSRARSASEGHETAASTAQAEPATVRSHGRWFALRVTSRHEFSVDRALRGAGVESFVPVYREETSWTDRTSLTTRPLFAGYAFARFDPSEAPAVLQARGVVQILGVGRPEAIPDEVIAGLRFADGRRAKSVPYCPHVAGDVVTVARGPFAGLTGEISRVRGATMLTIPVEILGRAVSVQIDAADVETNEC